MLQTVLRSWHAAHGGRLVDFAGWEMPVQYSSIVDEHHAVRRRAGIFDISHMGRIWFSGPDHVALLDKLLTNNVAKMPVGQVRYALVCREDGGILDDVLVTKFDNECLLVVNGANREKIVTWIDAHRDGLRVDIRDDTLRTCMIALQGPRALEVLQPHVPQDLTPLKYYWGTRGTAFGVPAIISRTGYTGEDGFELIVPDHEGPKVWDAILKAGAACQLLPCGLGCRDTLRLEAAMPLYGHEMDENVDPLTAGLGFGVKLDKTDFLGKAALQAIKSRGVALQRVGLKLQGKRIARQGAQLVSGGQVVGQVSSGTYSPTMEASLAMGYLPQAVVKSGAAVEVDIRGQREPVQVVALPFYRRA